MMEYIPTQWVNNAPPPIDAAVLTKIEQGIVDVASEFHEYSIPDYTYFVSQGFETDVDRHMFSSINDANEYVYNNLPPYPVKASIIVFPGLYEESIENSFYRIHIMGTADTSYYFKGAMLYNTGEDADHYPIKCSGASPLNLINMSVLVDQGGCYGAVPNLRADNCGFRDGYFTEYNGSGGRSMEFKECDMKGDSFKLFDTSGYRFIALRDCDLHNGTLEMCSCCEGITKLVKFERCISSADIEICGDWNINSFLSEMHGDGVLTIDNTGDMNLDKVLLPNGIHFRTNPQGQKQIVDCSFVNVDAAPEHRDITADTTITDVVLSGNDMQNGICDCIQIKNPEKNVGAGSRDRYFDLQSAVSSIPVGTHGTVRLWDDLIDLPEINLPYSNTKINIDGQKKYSLTFTGDIVSIGADRIAGFSDMVGVNGGAIELNGENSEISFESCQYVVAHLVLTDGLFAIVYKSSIFGDTGYPAISIDNIDTTMVVGYSRVQGSAGNSAVLFTDDADDKFKAKYSTFIHGDGGVNKPIDFTGIGKVDVAIYTSAFNAAMDPSKFHNTVGSPNNTVSAEITF